jgi:hypothetical protein
VDDDLRTTYLTAYQHIAAEGRGPLTVITGYVQLLLRDLLGPLTDDQREILAAIETRAMLTQTVLTQGETFFLASANVPHRPLSLGELEHEILDIIAVDRLHCEWTAPPSVRSLTVLGHTHLLARAITYLASTAYLTVSTALRGTATAELHNSTITFHINARDTFNLGNLEWHINTPGSPWNIARTIIEQHGSLLRITDSEQDYHFSFSLQTRDA